MIESATTQRVALALAVLLQACQTTATKPDTSDHSQVKAPTIEVILGDRGIVDKEILQDCKTTATLHQKFSQMIKERKDINYDISIQIEKLRKLGFGVLGTKVGGNEVVLSIIQQKNTATSQTFNCRADIGVFGLLTTVCSRVNHCIGRILDQSEKWFDSQARKS